MQGVHPNMSSQHWQHGVTLLVTGHAPLVLVWLPLQVSGKFRDVPRPVDMSALFTVGGVSSTGYLFPFNIGAEVTIKARGGEG